MRTKPPTVTYKKPPLTETWMGVQFAPIADWNVNLFGLYQYVVRDRYPRFENAVPLRFDAVPPPGVSIELVSIPKIRALYTDSARTRLIQVQDDLFFANWQKAMDGDPYPRYEQLVLDYVSEWEQFRLFLQENSVPLTAIIGYQLAYVNVFDPAADGAISIEDVLLNWRRVQGAIASRVKNLSLSATYAVGDVDLNYQLQPAIRIKDARNVFQFTLNTTTTKVDPAGADLKQRLDQLHDVLISGFQELTSDRAKRIWERQT